MFKKLKDLLIATFKPIWDKLKEFLEFIKKQFSE